MPYYKVLIACKFCIKKADIEATFNDIAGQLKDGSISCTPSMRNGLVGVKYVFEASKDLGKDKGKVSFTAKIEIYIHEGGFGIPTSVLASVYEAVPEYEERVSTVEPVYALLVAVTIVVSIAFTLEIALSAGVALIPAVANAFA